MNSKVRTTFSFWLLKFCFRTTAQSSGKPRDLPSKYVTRHTGIPNGRDVLANSYIQAFMLTILALKQ
uniref:Secreted protein n=1 Tax=Anguilla anguilla TaxID=7936 RepID=A0A0E9XIW0_ANGAN